MGTETILQDIKVFAIDNQYDVKAASEKGEKGEKSPAVKIISLLVTPEDAEVLTDVADRGKLDLVIRRPRRQGNQEAGRHQTEKPTPG